MSKAQRPRPLTRAQRAQNRRFLQALARTGNARLAARELGLNRSTFTKRRTKHPAFAAEWEAALQASQPRLARAAPGSSPAFAGHGGGAPSGCDPRLRTIGGEPAILRLKNGRLQLRRALPARMTPAAEQLFLTAFAQTNNLRLAADRAGFAHSSLIARRRRSPAFAARMKEAAAASPRQIDHFLREAAEAAAAELARQFAAPSVWPAGMTVAQVLHQLGAAPVKLPTTPFPRRKPRP